jgi:hypothetical protein
MLRAMSLKPTECPMRNYLLTASAAVVISSSAFAADIHGSPYPQYSSETTVIREAAPPPPPVVVKRTVTTTTTTIQSRADGGRYAETEYDVLPRGPRVRYSGDFVPAPVEAAPVYYRPHRPWWAYRHHGYPRHSFY